MDPGRAHRDPRVGRRRHRSARRVHRARGHPSHLHRLQLPDHAALSDPDRGHRRPAPRLRQVSGPPPDGAVAEPVVTLMPEDAARWIASNRHLSRSEAARRLPLRDQGEASRSGERPVERSQPGQYGVILTPETPLTGSGMQVRAASERSAMAGSGPSRCGFRLRCRGGLAKAST